MTSTFFVYKSKYIDYKGKDSNCIKLTVEELLFAYQFLKLFLWSASFSCVHDSAKPWIQISKKMKHFYWKHWCLNPRSGKPGKIGTNEVKYLHNILVDWRIAYNFHRMLILEFLGVCIKTTTKNYMKYSVWA